MTDTTAPAACTLLHHRAPAEDVKKRRRELVDKLLARPASKAKARSGSAARRWRMRRTLEFMPVSGPMFTDTGGEPEAAVFTTAYVLKGGESGRRPVCFAFNGGPGSASVWLHLGALGPKRVQVNDDGSMPLPPYAVSDNPHSWFEHFDLVFVDPPHTGYSIAASEEARTKLLSVDGDVEALAEVMRAWLGRHRRWDSPVYLAGESYGTTRGAALADRLQSLGVASRA
jgi:carboxypeptidase C (cathepsin A)